MLQRLNKILGFVDCPLGENLTSVKLKKGLVERILKSNDCLVKSNDCLVLSNDNTLIMAVSVARMIASHNNIVDWSFVIYTQCKNNIITTNDKALRATALNRCIFLKTRFIIPLFQSVNNIT